MMEKGGGEVITIRSGKKRKTLMFKKTYMFLFLKEDGFHSEPFELKSYNPFFRPNFKDIDQFTAHVNKTHPCNFVYYVRVR